MNEQSGPEPLDPTSPWADPPGAGRTLGLGVAVGAGTSFAVVFAAFLLGGQGLGAALGMGAFIAFWGGLGFGGMVGGVVWASRVNDAAEAERRERSAAPRAATEASPVSEDAAAGAGGAGVAHDVPSMVEAAG